LRPKSAPRVFRASHRELRGRVNVPTARQADLLVYVE